MVIITAFSTIAVLLTPFFPSKVELLVSPLLAVQSSLPPNQSPPHFRHPPHSLTHHTPTQKTLHPLCLTPHLRLPKFPYILLMTKHSRIRHPLILPLLPPHQWYRVSCHRVTQKKRRNQSRTTYDRKLTQR